MYIPVEEIICVRKTFVDLILDSSTCVNKPPTAAHYYFSFLIPVGNASWGSSINTICIYFLFSFKNFAHRIYDIGGVMLAVQSQCPGMS